MEVWNSIKIEYCLNLLQLNMLQFFKLNNYFDSWQMQFETINKNSKLQQCRRNSGSGVEYIKDMTVQSVKQSRGELGNNEICS